jgi:voltage-gated potassium channel Kch
VDARPDERHTRRRPLATLFLLDVLRDRESRPVFLLAGLTLLAGTTVFHFLEGWGWIDSLYFSAITLATVGYGDLVPTTPVAKIFTVLYVFNGVVILLTLFDRVRAVRSRRFEGVREARREPRA